MTEIVSVLPNELRRWRARDMLTNLLTNLQFRINEQLGIDSSNGGSEPHDMAHHLRVPEHIHFWSRHTMDLDYEDRINLGRAFQVSRGTDLLKGTAISCKMAKFIVILCVYTCTPDTQCDRRAKIRRFHGVAL